MCSIGEEDFGDVGGLHAMDSDKPSVRSNMFLGDCSSCGVNGTLVKLTLRSPECFNCFLAFARHKFRATLGSSKILPKGAEVILVFDGTDESIVLLDMMDFAQAQNAFKRLHVDTKVLFIDDCSVNTNTVRYFLSQYKFQSYVVSCSNEKSLCKLEDLDSYSNFNWSKNESTDDEFPMKKIKTLTSRQNFLKVWKTKLIATVAKRLKCNFVFLPDISNKLAADLINSIALGRGDSAAKDVSLLDNRLDDLKLLRPLRNLNNDEIQLYLKVKNLQSFKVDEYGETFGPNASIQNLTKRFVNDLQSNFSSTISTVFRVGDKIAPNFTTYSINERRKCTLCNSCLKISASKTLEAIEFSRLALSGYMHQAISNEELERKDISDLCYSCSNIQKECETVLPK